jgi:hypothetical protein
MKTAVETIFIGKDRQYNRRFLRMCLARGRAGRRTRSNQVGLVRERFFTPRLRVKSYDELNDWLMDKCIAWAKAHSIPKSPTERSGRCSRKSVPSSCRFDGFQA